MTILASFLSILCVSVFQKIITLDQKGQAQACAKVPKILSFALLVLPCLQPPYSFHCLDSHFSSSSVCCSINIHILCGGKTGSAITNGIMPMAMSWLSILSPDHASLNTT